jgi:hypothetical protein
MALHWYIKKKATDFKGFYIFLIAKRAEKDDFSQKSDEDGLAYSNLNNGATCKIINRKILQANISSRKAIF